MTDNRKDRTIMRNTKKHKGRAASNEKRVNPVRQYN